VDTDSDYRPPPAGDNGPHGQAGTPISCFAMTPPYCPRFIYAMNRAHAAARTPCAGSIFHGGRAGLLLRSKVLGAIVEPIVEKLVATSLGAKWFVIMNIVRKGEVWEQTKEVSKRKTSLFLCGLD